MAVENLTSQYSGFTLWFRNIPVFSVFCSRTRNEEARLTNFVLLFPSMSMFSNIPQQTLQIIGKHWNKEGIGTRWVKAGLKFASNVLIRQPLTEPCHSNIINAKPKKIYKKSNLTTKRKNSKVKKWKLKRSWMLGMCNDFKKTKAVCLIYRKFLQRLNKF